MKDKAMDEAELKRQRWLKAIVIGLGLMILVLLGGVIYTILFRGTKAEKQTFTPTASTSLSSEAGFGTIKIALPPGARFEEMKAENGHLYMRVSLASGGMRVIVLNPTTGRAYGSFEFVAP